MLYIYSYIYTYILRLYIRMNVYTCTFVDKCMLCEPGSKWRQKVIQDLISIRSHCRYEDKAPDVLSINRAVNYPITGMPRSRNFKGTFKTFFFYFCRIFTLDFNFTFVSTSSIEIDSESRSNPRKSYGGQGKITMQWHA